MACVEALFDGRPVEVGEENCEFFGSFTHELEYARLMRAAVRFQFAHQARTVANVLKRVRMLARYGMPQGDDLAFVAAYFGTLDREALKGLGREMVERVVGHEDLHLRDERQLLDFVVWRGSGFEALFGLVEFLHLKQEDIDLYLEHVNPDTMDGNSWKSICRALRRMIFKRASFVQKWQILQSEMHSKRKLNSEATIDLGR